MGARVTLGIARLTPRHVLGWAAAGAYVAALAVTVWSDGLPAARDRLVVWILLGFLAFSVTSVRRWARGVVLEWLPFVLILFAYDLVRGLADGLLFTAHVEPQIRADELLFGGVVPTVWLQERLWHGAADVRWYDYAAWGVYLSYFFATYLVAAGLWWRAPARFRRYVAAVSLLAAMGFATYALFPAAPPWLAADEGALPPTDRVAFAILDEFPVANFDSLLEEGARYSNKVAAVPSLHAAYTLLVVLALWRPAGRRRRPLLAAYPLLMAFALVYAGEHYVVDILLGWLYTLVAYVAVERLADGVARRREARAYTPVATGASASSARSTSAASL